ncbi:hypothetical protein DL771_007248 [Monosporascus sp. 5C6A]|nr:hypothetical protein DL771_007248 [Monosporascus sp. 5C6A]
MGTPQKFSGLAVKKIPRTPAPVDTVPQPPKQRFLIRTISSVLVPPAFAAYYIWTYVEFLRLSTRNRNVSSPTPDGRYIWWSWFIIGAIGLNVSTYVLADAEAGMLTTPRFGALTTDRLSMHKDESWSKISGWVDVGRKFVFREPVDRPFWPGSFKAGDTANASVVGVNATSFNRRSTFDVLDAAFHEWRQAGLARPPSVGAVYSIPGSSFDFNMTAGDTLPSTADSPIFRGPQAEVLELALWQDSDELGDLRNMEGIIPEFTGEYLNFGSYMDTENPNTLRPMAAIGVQCTSCSDSGFVRVDGFGGTFHDFSSHGVIGLLSDEADWFEFTRLRSGSALSRMIPEGLDRGALSATPTILLPGLRGSSAFDIMMEDASYEPLRDAEPWMPASDIDYRHVALSGGWFLDLASTDWLTAMPAAGNLPLDMSDHLSAGSVGYEWYFKPAERQRGLEEAHKHVAEKLMHNQ